MTLIVFSILDTKGGAFAAPFFMGSRGLATRAFSDLVLDKSTTVAQHPDDFRLFELGTFDVETGKLVALDTPKFIASAVEFTGPALTKGENHAGA